MFEQAGLAPAPGQQGSAMRRGVGGARRLAGRLPVHRILVWAVALATFGSGAVNLYSVMADPLLPERRAVLREFFPLEFLHVSRSITLLTGLALVIASLNIFRRKRRAFRVVVVLAALSIVFHLGKGLDYEEAFFSLVLLILLLAARKNFTVKSGTPDVRSGLVGLGVAAAVAVAYGVAGFWLLDPREFGLNFTIGDSIRRTLLFLSLAGDPATVPHTRYARWFLDSLYTMSAAVLVYGGVAIFRPAIYRFATHPHECALAGQIVERHGRSSQDFFKLWPDKSYYFSPSERAFIAYRVGASFAVALGDPVGPEEEIEETVRGFAALCRENDWGFAFHQTLPDFQAIYHRLGLRRLKIGDDAIVDLARFSLDGKAMKEQRTTIRRLESQGIGVKYWEPPLPDGVMEQLREVSDEWLEIPGRRERRFTLGMFEPSYLRTTPVVAAVDKDGSILGFVNVIPSYRRDETSIDLMRRRTAAPNGIMDYIFVKLMLMQKEKGFQRFNMGMAPMSGFQDKEEASPEERAVHYFFQRLNFMFSYRGLKLYKAKYAHIWEPRYAVYRNPLDLPRLALALGKVSELED